MQCHSGAIRSHVTLTVRAARQALHSTRSLQTSLHTFLRTFRDRTGTRFRIGRIYNVKHDLHIMGNMRWLPCILQRRCVIHELCDSQARCGPFNHSRREAIIESDRATRNIPAEAPSTEQCRRPGAPGSPTVPEHTRYAQNSCEKRRARRCALSV